VFASCLTGAVSVSLVKTKAIGVADNGSTGSFTGVPEAGFLNH